MLESGPVTGDPALDRLALALSGNDEAGLSHALAHIAQSPQMQDMAQWGRDLLATQHAEEQQVQQQQQAAVRAHSPGLTR